MTFDSVEKIHTNTNSQLTLLITKDAYSIHASIKFIKASLLLLYTLGHIWEEKGGRGQGNVQPLISMNIILVKDGAIKNYHEHNNN